jgi:transposase-like protein
MSMAQQGKRDLGKEEFWRNMVRMWQRSRPVTVRDFCAEHDVSEASFYAWRRTIAQRDRQGEAARPRADKFKQQARRAQGHDSDEQPVFVPLTVLPEPVGSSSVTLEVVLRSGRVVRVPSGFDPGTLRQLLTLLEEERPC